MADQKLTVLKGVGEKRAQLFHKLGVFSVGALLHYYPRDYIDLSRPLSPLEAPYDTPCAVKATVITPVQEHYVRRGMVLYRFTAMADNVSIKITLFNNKYAAQKIKQNQSYIFYGKLTGNFVKKEMSSPEILSVDSTYIRPVYKATEGLPSYQIEKAMRLAIAYSDLLEDSLPIKIREKYNLQDLKTAIQNIHFPSSQDALKKAQQRLVFEELLLLQCGIIYLGNKRNHHSNYKLDTRCFEPFKQLLPYQLTGAQVRAITECLRDMASGLQMNRLIQGDVGSGKTAVAQALCYVCAKNKIQSAVMAPTEILAIQHFESFQDIFKNTDIRIALLTGSTGTKTKRELLEQLQLGQIDILIGTHAIIEDNVAFRNLGLIIADEQHRFGVNQRSKLSQKSNYPHTLVMSATPIPRTLALMIYGDLDLSVLDELPPGRQKIDTFVVDQSYHPRLYTFIKKHLDQGLQGYIVCPLVEDNESGLISAEEYAKELQKVFSQYRVGLLHGKMKSAEKETIMDQFVSGKLQLLVSTTVIEVGVNVPNAVIMMVENAERFGLSQLHQLRGRVGRGRSKSYCILVSNATGGAALSRLDLMKETNDGFKIADFDLKLRGPGDFFGQRQHGLPQLKIADLFADMPALSKAKEASLAIIKDDPSLEQPDNQGLKQAILQLFEASQSTLS